MLYQRKTMAKALGCHFFMIAYLGISQQQKQPSLPSLRSLGKAAKPQGFSMSRVAHVGLAFSDCRVVVL